MSIVVPTILSDGKEIDPTIQILSIDATREVNRIPYARLVLQDGDVASQDFPVSNMALFEPGREIEIRLRYEGDPASEKTIFRGLVIKHEIEARSSGSRLTLDLKDAAFKMTRVRNSAIFLKQDDSAIFAKLIGDAEGVKEGDIAETQIQHETMVQVQTSDWDFLRLRAEALGRFVLVEDGTVSVVTLPASGRNKLELTFGIDPIFNLNLELDASAQMKEFEAVAWSMKNQELGNLHKSESFRLEQGNLPASDAANALGDVHSILRSDPSLPNGELKQWANARMVQSRLSFIQGVISVEGAAGIRLLDGLKLNGVGKRFEGINWITGIRHRVSSEGWQTDLQVGLPSGRFSEAEDIQAPTASGLLPPARTLLTGIVVELSPDPEKEYRIGIQLPSVDGGQETVWARLATPYAGKERGLIFRPEPGDEVIVGFLNDDPRYPLILGTLFGSMNTPPESIAQDEEKNEEKVIVSRTGLKLSFRDSEAPALLLETPAGNALRLDDQEEQLEITDQHGNSILLSADGIEIKSAKDLTVSASANVEITGTKVDLK